MRMEDAVLHGCVPVIIQDNVQVRQGDGQQTGPV
jgi:hypothetical protein